MWIWCSKASENSSCKTGDHLSSGISKSSPDFWRTGFNHFSVRPGFRFCPDFFWSGNGPRIGFRYGATPLMRMRLILNKPGSIPLENGSQSQRPPVLPGPERGGDWSASPSIPVVNRSSVSSHKKAPHKLRGALKGRGFPLEFTNPYRLAWTGKRAFRQVNTPLAYPARIGGIDGRIARVDVQIRQPFRFARLFSCSGIFSSHPISFLIIAWRCFSTSINASLRSSFATVSR